MVFDYICRVQTNELSSEQGAHAKGVKFPTGDESTRSGVNSEEFRLLNC